MKRIERIALVPFSDQQMFDLINDIEAYPLFMKECVGAQVLKRGEGWLEARLDLAKAGITQSFVTRNELRPPSEMTLNLVSGPFKNLRGAWTFKPLDGGACKVGFWLEFEFSNRLIAMAAGKLFELVASEQVDMVCQRARALYSASTN